MSLAITPRASSSLVKNDLFQKTFFSDVVKGLSSPAKYLQSKYFYDAEGDRLFQELMNCPEYYLTECEYEIFTKKTGILSDIIRQRLAYYDIIELGAGDAYKSSRLLAHLKLQDDYTYFPIDISANTIELLEKNLPVQIHGLQITGLHGEYFTMLEKAYDLSGKPKVILLLGSNIGNMPVKDAGEFCKKLSAYLNKGDLLLLGVDLKKNPVTILGAYNDKQGITKRFNLNLLKRINRELHADFNTDEFEHYACYDPQTGSCKSFLISRIHQQVHLGGSATINFEKDEIIYMEISQKYTLQEINQVGTESGFELVDSITDSKQWFADVIWQRT